MVFFFFCDTFSVLLGGRRALVIPCHAPLLDRLEDTTNGRVLVPGCDVEIPPRRWHEIEEVAAEFGDAAAGQSPP